MLWCFTVFAFWAGFGRAGPGRAGLGRAGPGWAGLGWAGLGWAGLGRAGLGCGTFCWRGGRLDVRSARPLGDPAGPSRNHWFRKTVFAAPSPSPEGRGEREVTAPLFRRRAGVGCTCSSVLTFKVPEAGGHLSAWISQTSQRLAVCCACFETITATPDHPEPPLNPELPKTVQTTLDCPNYPELPTSLIGSVLHC